MRRCWLATVSGLISAGWLGWLTPAASWPAATGWDRIPPAWRPATGPLWSRPGDAPAPTLRWLGHAGFVIDWAGTRLVVDPNTSRRCTVARRVLEGPEAVEARLGTVDAVLISHAHFDHLDLPTLRRLPAVRRIVVPRGSERYVAALASAETAVLGLAPGRAAAIGALEVTAVPARHNGNRLHPLASHERAVGWVIRHDGDALYVAGDTGFGDGSAFRTVAREHRPRAAILPIGAYLPRWPLAAYHLSPEQAVEAARLLGVETVVPGHFGTFTLSFDRPSWALPRFAAAAHDARLSWRMPRLAGMETNPARAMEGTP